MIEDPSPPGIMSRTARDRSPWPEDPCASTGLCLVSLRRSRPPSLYAALTRPRLTPRVPLPPYNYPPYPLSPFPTLRRLRGHPCHIVVDSHDDDVYVSGETPPSIPYRASGAEMPPLRDVAPSARVGLYFADRFGVVRVGFSRREG